MTSFLLTLALVSASTSACQTAYIKMSTDLGQDSLNMRRHISSINNYQCSLEYSGILYTLALNGSYKKFVEYGDYDPDSAISALKKLKGSSEMTSSKINHLVLSFAKTRPSIAEQLSVQIYGKSQI
eukprot:NODE_316_length_11188_cov_0.303905.p8 type:complete len:126 gc:universal NODE_316_length_11188_cov_0.303905:3086-2709(-)